MSHQPEPEPEIEPEIAHRLAFASARLKADTDPPSLQDFPAATPRAARLQMVPAGYVVDPVLGEPVEVALSDARLNLRVARQRLEALHAEIIKLWPHGAPPPPGDEPPAAA